MQPMELRWPVPYFITPDRPKVFIAMPPVRVGDFTCFMATEKGFGTVSLSGDRVQIRIALGEIAVNQVLLSGRIVPYSVKSMSEPNL